MSAVWFVIWLGVLGNTLLIYFPFFLLESFFPNRRNAPPTHYWWLRVSFLLVLRTSTVVLMLLTISNYDFFSRWDARYLQDLRAFWDAQPVAWSFAAALLAYTFVQYWTHVIRHRNPAIWRWCHQLHHSPTRFNIFLSYYVHPTDILFTNGIICFAMLFGGFSYENYRILCFFHIFLDATQHVNIKTPRWLGYFMFRPEQHGLHHSAHNFNFGIITLWDLIFRTFRNPAAQQAKVGFSSEAEGRFWDTFWGRSV